ncbi:MAG TPA: TIGR02234 family membrane protein [Mycobacterium sp.]|nr:TIGR02234 family membrane protein [Mycobacterium sp.]
MANPRPDRWGRLAIGMAQVLLVAAAGALWAASRLPWVVIRSFDGLGPPKAATLSGASWSTALLPLALLLLATAVAAVAVRGWPLRVLAVLVAAASLAIGYLAVSLWEVPDVALRGADLAHVPVLSLVGSERHYLGAAVTLTAAVCTLVAAVLLMRSATSTGATKYATPTARRSMARRDDADAMSERMIWDALDEGRDPTDRPREGAGPHDHESDTEGR